jgi:general L-amino acid transport system substrate-binding protein
MVKRIVVAALLALIVLSVSVVAAQDAGAQLGPITQKVVDRGELICGVNQAVPGFGLLDTNTGEFTGFDVDFCRAFAAAILGDSTAVSYRFVTGSDRQAVIQSGEIDVLSRNTTWTLSRDALWGVTFAPTTFYDGQGLGVTVDSGFETIEDLDGGSVCVQAGTTTELNITDAITSRGLTIDIQTYPDADSTWSAFESGRCDAWTTDKSGIVAFHAGRAADPSLYKILDITLSKEPLGPLSQQSDPQFADIIAWTIFGMIQAEEFGITSQNVDDFLTSEDPEIQRLLGQGGNDAGNYLGIANDFMVTVLKQVGNYGEVYDRNLGVAPFNLARGLNDLYTNGGLLYAPPFR